MCIYITPPLFHSATGPTRSLLDSAYLCIYIQIYRSRYSYVDIPIHIDIDRDSEREVRVNTRPEPTNVAKLAKMQWAHEGLQ